MNNTLERIDELLAERDLLNDDLQNANTHDEIHHFKTELQLVEDELEKIDVSDLYPQVLDTDDPLELADHLIKLSNKNLNKATYHHKIAERHTHIASVYNRAVRVIFNKLDEEAQ